MSINTDYTVCCFEEEIIQRSSQLASLTLTKDQLGGISVFFSLCSLNAQSSKKLHSEILLPSIRVHGACLVRKVLAGVTVWKCFLGRHIPWLLKNIRTIFHVRTLIWSAIRYSHVKSTLKWALPKKITLHVTRFQKHGSLCFIHFIIDVFFFFFWCKTAMQSFLYCTPFLHI